MELEILNKFAEEVHQLAWKKGFYEEGYNKERKMGDWIANLHSEVSELWEAYRNDKLLSPCDKSEAMQEKLGESLNCAEEELADILIRTLDVGKALKIDLARAVKIKHAYNMTREFKHGYKKA